MRAVDRVGQFHRLAKLYPGDPVGRCILREVERRDASIEYPSYECMRMDGNHLQIFSAKVSSYFAL